MPMRHMGSLGKTTEEGMEPLILPEVGSGVVIYGGIDGVMGHRRNLLSALKIDSSTSTGKVKYALEPLWHGSPKRVDIKA